MSFDSTLAQNFAAGPYRTPKGAIPGNRITIATGRMVATICARESVPIAFSIIDVFLLLRTKGSYAP